MVIIDYTEVDPLRGDIIVFDSKVSDMKLVKRVVGVPGDVVQLSDNVLMINGEQLPYEDIASTQLHQLFHTHRSPPYSPTNHTQTQGPTLWRRE